MAENTATKIIDEIRTLLRVAEMTHSEGEWHSAMLRVGKNFKELDVILSDPELPANSLPVQWIPEPKWNWDPWSGKFVEGKIL